MRHYRNAKTGAVHASVVPGKMLCGIGLTSKFAPTDRAFTCYECKHKVKGGTKHHVTALDDPVYELARDIGGDLPDSAFWALYHELGG